MEYIRISEYVVPKDVVDEYIEHIIRSHARVRHLGFSGYEYERARLHNAVFLAAGFKDTRWGTARKTAAWFSTMTPADSRMRTDPDIGYDDNLVQFSEKLDELVGEIYERKKDR